MRLLAEGTRFLGFWIGSTNAGWAALQSLASTWPIVLRAVPAESTLARHLHADEATFVLVRPDAYGAAKVEAATLASAEAALRAALSFAAMQSSSAKAAA